MTCACATVVAVYIGAMEADPPPATELLRSVPEEWNIWVDESGNVTRQKLPAGSVLAVGSTRVPPGARLVIWGNQLRSVWATERTSDPRPAAVAQMQGTVAVLPPRPANVLAIVATNNRDDGSKIHVGYVYDEPPWVGGNNPCG